MAPGWKDVPDFDGDWSFGLERYRTELWGTDIVRSVGAELIGRLVSEVLYVGNDELDTLEQEARDIAASADTTARRLFDPSQPGDGVVVVQSAEGSQVHNA